MASAKPPGGGPPPIRFCESCFDRPGVVLVNFTAEDGTPGRLPPRWLCAVCDREELAAMESPDDFE